MNNARMVAAAWLSALLIAGAQQSLAADADEAKARILEQFPELTADNLTPTPMEGLYQISMGGRVAYVSADGRYLIQGDLFDVEAEVNLTEQSRIQARLDAVNAVSESSMIVFEQPAAVHTVTVFTDIDCGYCRKLHRQIADYNAEGIRVRYMFFPRSGPNTDSWFKADNVWCADDRNSAMTRAKAGETIESDDCGATPVDQHYQLGQDLGIRGTPAIITDGGQLIPGYVPPSELLGLLNEGES